jgi:hypothetical protein
VRLKRCCSNFSTSASTWSILASNIIFRDNDSLELRHVKRYSAMSTSSQSGRKKSKYSRSWRAASSVGAAGAMHHINVGKSRETDCAGNRATPRQLHVECRFVGSSTSDCSAELLTHLAKIKVEKPFSVTRPPEACGEKNRNRTFPHLFLIQNVRFKSELGFS